MKFYKRLKTKFFEVDTATANIRWLGDDIALTIYVSETYEALLGVELLADSVLEIDYRNGSVKITK